MLGGLLSLLAALTFALNNAFARRGVLTGSVMQALAVSVPFGVPFLFVATWVFGGLPAIAGFSTASLLWLAAAGIVHFCMGRYCNYRATKAIGANLVGPLQDLNIIYSMVMAVVILDEKITVLKVIGFVLVMFGPVIVLNKPGKAKKQETKKSTFTPVYAEGYLFGFLSGVCYGTSPILVRQGLLTSDIGASVAGSFVSYCAATAVVVLLMFIPGNAGDVRKLQWSTARWFAVAGLFVAISQMVRYMALAVAPVTVVQPISRLSSLFRIYFGWLLNREHEIFSRKVIVATVISLCGALVLSLDAGYVLELRDWPQWAVGALRWRWP